MFRHLVARNGIHPAADSRNPAGGQRRSEGIARDSKRHQIAGADERFPTEQRFEPGITGTSHCQSIQYVGTYFQVTTVCIWPVMLASALGGRMHGTDAMAAKHKHHQRLEGELHDPLTRRVVIEMSPPHPSSGADANPLHHRQI
jgi:hypothetical protein